MWFLLVTASMFTAIDVSASGLSEVAPARAEQFGYDAVENKSRRKQARVYSGSEDRVLDHSKRRKLTANAQDIRRNFSIAAWIVRRHLDYVASFDFHSRTGVDEIDDRIELLMKLQSRPVACDVRGRHSLSSMVRMAEAHRSIDGDVFIEKLRSRHLGGIEGDRVKNHAGSNDPDRWVHGVRLNRAGRALGYAVHRRVGFGSLQFEKQVPAANMIHHGFFDRYDQVRGISPIASALNPLRDVYENFDYALAKAKVSQLFALAFYREAEDSGGLGEGGEDENGEEDKSSYTVDFGRGPINLDLDPGDRAEILESKTPSTEFQNFTQLVLTAAMKALDVPYSFYDESHTNFFGSRAAWLHYERSCGPKRESIAEMLRQITVFWIQRWILDGLLVLPADMGIGDLGWEWVPRGMPWWDPAKEIRGDMMAIAGGLDNPQRITKERGRGDFKDNVDQIAEAIAYAKEKGVPLSFAVTGAPQEVEVVNDDG